MKKPLPTNSWCEDLFLETTTDFLNRAVQFPYIIDTGGKIPGIRTHAMSVGSNPRAVMLSYETQNGVTLGGVESFAPQHLIATDEATSIGRLSVVLGIWIFV